MKKISQLSLENVVLDVDEDGIATVTLNRPAKRNALDAATIDELIEVFATLPRAGVRACVLRGEARISAPGWTWSSTTTRTARPPTSCTSACAGTRRSTRWSTAACR